MNLMLRNSTTCISFSDLLSTAWTAGLKTADYFVLFFFFTVMCYKVDNVVSSGWKNTGCIRWQKSILHVYCTVPQPNKRPVKRLNCRHSRSNSADLTQGRYWLCWSLDRWSLQGMLLFLQVLTWVGIFLVAWVTAFLIAAWDTKQWFLHRDTQRHSRSWKIHLQSLLWWFHSPLRILYGMCSLTKKIYILHSFYWQLWWNLFFFF